MIDIERRFKFKLPNSIKNPRKLKKSWKRRIISKLQESGIKRGGWMLRWEPRHGWCVTIGVRYRPLSK